MVEQRLWRPLLAEGGDGEQKRGRFHPSGARTHRRGAEHEVLHGVDKALWVLTIVEPGAVQHEAAGLFAVALRNCAIREAGWVCGRREGRGGLRLARPRSTRKTLQHAMFVP